MIRGSTSIIMVVLVSGCVSSGLQNEPPIVRFPINPVNVTVNRAIPNDFFFDSLVFTINDVETYKFGNQKSYSFSLGEGHYVFGYQQGLLFKTKCGVDVDIETNHNYVFNLEPDCLIRPE